MNKRLIIEDHDYLPEVDYERFVDPLRSPPVSVRDLLEMQEAQRVTIKDLTAELERDAAGMLALGQDETIARQSANIHKMRETIREGQEIVREGKEIIQRQANTIRLQQLEIEDLQETLDSPLVEVRFSRPRMRNRTTGRFAG